MTQRLCNLHKPEDALTRLMAGMIFGIRTWDPIVFVAVAALMGAVAWLAAYLPSVRATRVDPVESLRYRPGPTLVCCGRLRHRVPV